MVGPWLQQSVKWRHHNLRETLETTFTSFTSLSLTYSPFSLRRRPRPVRRHITSDPVELFYPSRAFLSSPSSASFSSVPLFSPKEGLLTSTRRNFWQSRPTSGGGGTTLTFINVYITRSSCLRNYSPDCDALLVDCGDPMVFGDNNAYHPSQSALRNDRAAARVEDTTSTAVKLLITEEGSARPMEDPLGVLRPRHQSQVLLVSSAEDRQHEFTFDGKPTPGRR